MGAIKIRQLKYRQNYSFDSTSTASFFFTRFIWHEVRQEFYSEKNRVFPFGFHFESWASPKVLLLCTQNTLLGTAPSGVFVRQKKKYFKMTKKKLWKWRNGFKNRWKGGGVVDVISHFSSIAGRSSGPGSAAGWRLSGAVNKTHKIPILVPEPQRSTVFWWKLASHSKWQEFIRLFCLIFVFLSLQTV